MPYYRNSGKPARKRERSGHEKIRKEQRIIRISAGLVIIIVLAIAVLAVQLGWSGDVPSHVPAEKSPFEQSVEVCVSDNPWISEEQCMDLRYHDRAITDGDESLCERIKGEKVKNHCKEYFV
jgi:hypothetical protein